MGQTILESGAVSLAAQAAQSAPEQAQEADPALAAVRPNSATVIPQAAIAALAAPVSGPKTGDSQPVTSAAAPAEPPTSAPTPELAPVPDAASQEPDSPSLAGSGANTPMASEEAVRRDNAATSLETGKARREAGTPSPRLVSVLHDGTDGDSVDVTDDCFDIGRMEGQCQFASDPYLSDRHCRFERRDQDWFVIDLDSRNGIYRRLSGSQTLGDREQVLAGTHVFVFDRVARAEYEAGPAMEQGVMLFGSPLRRPWGCLRILTTAGVYRDTRFIHRPELVVGRESGDWSFAEDEFMSRRHFSVGLIDGAPAVSDLGSSNGTYLRLRKGCKLSSGDRIRAGNQLLRFELPD